MSEEKKDPTSHPDEYLNEIDRINAELDNIPSLQRRLESESYQASNKLETLKPFKELLEPIKPFPELIQETLEWLEDRLKHVESKVLFGIPGIDSLLHPIEPGDQIVICADSGRGKTALALQAIIRSQPKKSLIFSLEMSAKPLVARMIAAHAVVRLTNMRRGFISELEYSKMIPAVDEMQNWDVWIDEKSSSVTQICERAQEIKPDLIVVDYLQLVVPSKSKRDSSREREVAEISRTLKRLALELPCTVLALSQLNDDGKLRESRAIGQDADVILKIYPEKEENPNDLIAKVLKHRNGTVGKSRVRFMGEFMRFEEIKEVDKQ